MGGLEVAGGVAVERVGATLERVEARGGEAPQVADGGHLPRRGSGLGVTSEEG